MMMKGGCDMGDDGGGRQMIESPKGRGRGKYKSKQEEQK